MHVDDEVSEMRKTLQMRVEQVNKLASSVEALDEEVKKLNSTLKSQKAINKGLEEKV